MEINGCGGSSFHTEGITED